MMGQTMSSFHEVVTSLLQNLGSRKEVDRYLRAFSSVESTRFAVIKVGGVILQDDRDALVAALAFLHEIGLTPILVHGAGPQLNHALEQQGVAVERIEGLRVTSPEVLNIARRVFQSESLALAEALEAHGVRARPIAGGVFEASPVDSHRLGLVGQVERVDLGPIEAAIRAGYLPVLSSLGETPAGQILNINADVATRELAIALQPSKVIYLTGTGGLLNEKGAILPAINLVEDFDTLMDAEWVTGGMRLKLSEIKHLLDALPATSSVSITTPEHLVRELFTHQGCGTLIRKGLPLERHDSLDTVDLTRLGSLIEKSFGRTLSSEYLTTLSVDRLFISPDYAAAAVITQGPNVAYLDKFAVTAEAQGAGLGASLWNRIREDTPSLVWRSRDSNPINPWYFARADGMRRCGRWIVFWYGIDDSNQIDAAVTYASSRHESFEPPTINVVSESKESSHAT